MLNLTQNIKYKKVEDDSKIIISTNCLHSVSDINSFILSTDEDVSNFFVKSFRYSLNFGIDFSDFIDLSLSNLQNITFEENIFSIIEIKLVKKGNPTFYDFSINVSFFTIELELNYFENTYLDFEGDYSLVVDLCASLIRKLNFSILPKFVERTSDFVDLFYSICFLLSTIKRFALKIRKYDEYIDFLNLYLNQIGLFTCNDQPIEELSFLKETLFNEFRRRGTQTSFLKSDDLQEISNGEVLRMICYENCDEFILDNTKPEQIGWNLGNSSPLNRHLYNHNSTNKSYEKFTKSIIDLSKYPLIEPDNCSIENDYLKVVSSGGIGSEIYDEEKAIIVDPNLDYEISFLISVSSVNDHITLKVNSFDCSGEFKNLRDLSCSVSNGNVDNLNNKFLDNETLPFPNKWILIRCIIYRKWFTQLENSLISEKLNINKGTNLRFSDGISKIIPCILLDSGGEVKIKDLRIQPVKTVYSQGFIQTNNWINIWLKDNNSIQNRQTFFIGIEEDCEQVGFELSDDEQKVDYRYFEKDLVNSLFGFSNLTYQNLRQFFINYDSNFWVNFLGDFREVEFKDCIRPEGFIGVDQYCEERPEGFIGVDQYCEIYQDGLIFDGVNDYVQTPLIPLQTNYNDTFSISCFVNAITSTINPLFIGNETIPLGVFFYIDTSVNRLALVLFNDGFIGETWQCPFSLTLTETYNLSFTYNAGSVMFYINGESIAPTVNFRFGGYDGTQNTTNTIGYTLSARPSTGFYVNSIFFDFKVFNQSLSNEDMLDLYLTRGDSNPHCSKTPIFELNFNEKSGFIAIENISNNHSFLINFTNEDTGIGSPTSKWIRSIIK